MKQKMIFLATLVIWGGLVSLGKPSSSLAADWYCASPQAYVCCYVYNHGSYCGGCDCINYDTIPSCAVSGDCNCRATGNECGSSSPEICNQGSGGWIYQYDGKCTRPDRNPLTGLCPGSWYYKYKECSAADRCEDSSVGNVAWGCGGGGGTGSNTTGKILPGICSAGTCSQGCRNGGHYKTCCHVSGAAVAGTRLSGAIGTCSGGFCSAGVPVRWADFRSPGPSCSNTLCLQSWDGWSWIVDTCGPDAPPTIIPGVPTPTPGTPVAPPPEPGTFCGGCSSYWSCDWGGSGGCSVSPCERLYHGYGPDPCPVSGPIHGGSCCSWCFSKGWSLDCGSASPAVPSLNSPANGASMKGAGVEFKWYKYQTGETGKCGGCTASKNQNFCWGFRCASGGYGIPTTWRKYDLFVSRVANLTSTQASAKNPSHWGAARVTINGAVDSGDPALKVKGESGYVSPDLISRVVDFSSQNVGTYWWFVRACNPDGCKDSKLRSFNFCASSPPGQANCDSPNGVTLNETSTDLSWTGPADWGQGCPDDQSYEIYFDTKFPPSSWSGVAVASSPYAVNDLEYGTRYFWSVKTVNNGMSSYGKPCDFLVKEPDPWWQSKDGDIHGGVSLSSTYIPKCATTEKYLSIDGDSGSPGVVSWGGLTLPNVGWGEISSTGWQANTSISVPFSFTYLKNRLQVNEKVVLPLTGGEAVIPEESGTFYSDNESLSLQLEGRTLKAGEKVVIFALGNVTITSDIIVPPGSFFALIAKGNINFDGAVTRAEGFFLADKLLVVASGNTAFAGYGSFVGLQGISLRRDLSNGITGGCDRAEVFTFRPDFLFSAPSNFLLTKFLFQELAP